MAIISSSQSAPSYLKLVARSAIVRKYGMHLVLLALILVTSIGSPSSLPARTSRTCCFRRHHSELW